METNSKVLTKMESEYREQWFIPKPSVRMKVPFLAKSFMDMESLVILMEEL